MEKKTILALAMLTMLAYPAENIHLRLANDTQFDLLFSARQADLAEYFKATGVVIQDVPLMNPFFTGLRVDQCAKKIWYFESTQVVLPCFATMADKVSWQYNSHMRRMLRGITAYNAGNYSEGRMIINENSVEYIPLKGE